MDRLSAGANRGHLTGVMRRIRTPGSLDPGGEAPRSEDLIQFDSIKLDESRQFTL